MHEGYTNLSTDMALAVCKKFLRDMAQPSNVNQLGVSLWDLNRVLMEEEKERKRRETLEEVHMGGTGQQEVHNEEDNMDLEL